MPTWSGCDGIAARYSRSDARLLALYSPSHGRTTGNRTNPSHRPRGGSDFFRRTNPRHTFARPHPAPEISHAKESRKTRHWRRRKRYLRNESRMTRRASTSEQTSRPEDARRRPRRCRLAEETSHADAERRLAKLLRRSRWREKNMQLLAEYDKPLPPPWPSDEAPRRRSTPERACRAREDASRFRLRGRNEVPPSSATTTRASTRRRRYLARARRETGGQKENPGGEPRTRTFPARTPTGSRETEIPESKAGKRRGESRGGAG